MPTSSQMRPRWCLNWKMSSWLFLIVIMTGWSKSGRWGGVLRDRAETSVGGKGCPRRGPVAPGVSDDPFTAISCPSSRCWRSQPAACIDPISASTDPLGLALGVRFAIRFGQRRPPSTWLAAVRRLAGDGCRASRLPHPDDRVEGVPDRAPLASPARSPQAAARSQPCCATWAGRCADGRPDSWLACACVGPPHVVTPTPGPGFWASHVHLLVRSGPHVPAAGPGRGGRRHPVARSGGARVPPAAHGAYGPSRGSTNHHVVAPTCCLSGARADDGRDPPGPPPPPARRACACAAAGDWGPAGGRRAGVPPARSRTRRRAGRRGGGATRPPHVRGVHGRAAAAAADAAPSPPWSGFGVAAPEAAPRQAACRNRQPRERVGGGAHTQAPAARVHWPWRCARGRVAPRRRVSRPHPGSPRRRVSRPHANRSTAAASDSCPTLIPDTPSLRLPIAPI